MDPGFRRDDGTLTLSHERCDRLRLQRHPLLAAVELLRAHFLETATCMEAGRRRIRRLDIEFAGQLRIATVRSERGDVVV